MVDKSCIHCEYKCSYISRECTRNSSRLSFWSDAGCRYTRPARPHPHLRHSRERRPLRNSRCGRQRGGDGEYSWRGTPNPGFPPARERRAGGGPPHNRHSHNSGNPRQPHRHSRDRRESTAGAGDGFPSPRERRARGGPPHNRHSQNSGHPRESSFATAGRGAPQSSFPRRREWSGMKDAGLPPLRRHGGGRRWVPVSTGTTDGGGAPHNRHSQNSGNPRQPHRHSRDGGGPAMGSRLHGNDGRRRRTPQSSFPRRRESTAATSSFPATAGRGAPQSSFPRRRESIPDMVRHHDS